MHAFIFIFVWFNKNISIPKIDFNFFILLNEYVSSCECMLYAYVYVCTCVDTFVHRSQICVYYMFMYMSAHVYICTWRPCGHVCMHGCVCICLWTCLHMCIWIYSWRPDLEGGYHSQSISTLFFKTGSLIETRAHQMCSLPGQWT